MFSVYFVLLAVLLTVLRNPQQSSNGFTGSRILLLTAHPDDECLFFAPTLLALTNAAELYSLTLSTGNADGLGEIRKQELKGSLDILRIKPERRWTIDNPQLQDNITQDWEANVIADAIRPYVLHHQIDTILTFDHEGISSHPNHKSLPSGVKGLIHGLNSTAPPRLFSLITVPLVTKYSGVVSPLLAKVDLSINRAMYHLEVAVLPVLQQTLQIPITSKPSESGYAAHTVMPVFVSGLKEYWQAVQAMRKHESQLVWFRYLYVSFSRYMWVNEWMEYAP